jgi:hypothetical protein
MSRATKAAPEISSGLAAHTEGNFYYFDDEPGKRYPRMTGVIGLLDKSRQLTQWAAREERALWRSHAVGVVAELLARPASSLSSTLDEWMAVLDERVGASFACNRKLKKAGDIGTQAHLLIEWTQKLALGIPAARPDVSDAAELAFMAFQDWAKEHELRPIATEVAVRSRKLGIAGRIDWIGLVDDRVTVIDWKTGKDIYDEAVYQNVGYRVCLLETAPELPALAEILDDDRLSCAEPAGLVIRLPKELWKAGDPVPFEARSMPGIGGKEFAEVLTCLQGLIPNFYRSEKKNEEWKRANPRSARAK